MDKEEKIMKGNLKITVFDSFDFNELSRIIGLISATGYKATFLERGVVVLQKERPSKIMMETFKELRNNEISKNK